MMYRFRNILIGLVFFVFAIMMLSGILSGFTVYVLYHIGIVSDNTSRPVVIILVMLIVSTIIGSAMTYFVGDFVLRPIRELIAATREVAKGNFNVELRDECVNSELRELIRSFNHMTKELNSIELFRKDFINNFSHEFRTPIVSIRGFARQLQQETLTEEQKREYTDIIIYEAERLANMSTNVLLLTKLENQEIVSDKKPFSLDEQLRNCILLLQMQWEKKNIELQLELDPVMYEGNEEMLSHVWLNLLNNAIKFSHEGGQIQVVCHYDGHRVKVKVSDKGTGMDDETRNRVFERFYQGDPARASEGNGLGLPLAKRIVELCAGKITIKSQLGKGTDVVVRLPYEV